jgi:hypothetical protein
VGYEDPDVPDRLSALGSGTQSQVLAWQNPLERLRNAAKIPCNFFPNLSQCMNEDSELNPRYEKKT